MDFGLARAAGMAGPASASGTAMATATHSPTMAAPTRAFEGKSQASLIGSILHREPPSIAQLAPMSPPGRDRLVQACLA